MKFYLDHNIYIYSLSNPTISEVIKELKSKDIQFFYSPAHIEEIYKAKSDFGDEYSENAIKLLKTISKFTDNMELLPSASGVIEKEEKPLECYKRVSFFDTTERVKKDSKIRYEVDKNNYESMK